MKIPKHIRILYTDYCPKFYNTHEKQSTTFGIRCKKGAAAPILELLYFRLCHKILVQTGSWTNNATLSIVLLIQFTFYGESYYGILHHKQPAIQCFVRCANMTWNYVRHFSSNGNSRIGFQLFFSQNWLFLHVDPF